MISSDHLQPDPFGTIADVIELVPAPAAWDCG